MLLLAFQCPKFCRISFSARGICWKMKPWLFEAYGQNQGVAAPHNGPATAVNPLIQSAQLFFKNTDDLTWSSCS
jgi:hypothetical protein